MQLKRKKLSLVPLRRFEHISVFACLGARKGLGVIHWGPVLLSATKQTQSEGGKEAANTGARAEGRVLATAGLPRAGSPALSLRCLGSNRPSSGCGASGPFLALSVPWLLLCAGGWQGVLTLSGLRSERSRHVLILVTSTGAPLAALPRCEMTAFPAGTQPYLPTHQRPHFT